MIHTQQQPARQFKHYLAVAPFPSRSHSPSIGVKVSRPSPACVQIWALKPRAQDDDNEMAEDRPRSEAEVRCEMVLCLESGPAQEIKWCPLPAHDQVCSHLYRSSVLGAEMTPSGTYDPEIHEN